MLFPPLLETVAEDEDAEREEDEAGDGVESGEGVGARFGEIAWCAVLEEETDGRLVGMLKGAIGR